MAKDSLLNINYIENSTIYDLPPDLDVVADDLLLIARPNYKNKYTKRIDKDYPYEGYNSTVSQLSSQVAETMLLKNEVILGKWRFIHNPIVLDNYKLTGNVSGKVAATKWYVDSMYKKALKKLYDLSAYIYDEDNPHIPSYVGMVITTSINSESRIKEIYGGNHWQLTCENKCLVGANDLMDAYKFNVIGGNDSIKLTVKQSPVAFHEHYIGCSKSRTFNTASYSIPTISGGGRAHRRHSHLHDYLIAGAVVIAFVAAVVVSVIIAIGSGGTASGFSVALTNSVGATMSAVISGLIVGAVSLAASTLATWVLGKFTEFSASAIKNIMLGAQIAASVAAFCTMYFDFTSAATNGASEASSTAAGASSVQTATQNESNQLASALTNAVKANSEAPSLTSFGPDKALADALTNAASNGSNATSISMPFDALKTTSSGLADSLTTAASSGMQTAPSITMDLVPSAQTAGSLADALTNAAAGSSQAITQGTSSALADALVGALNTSTVSDSVLMNAAAAEIASGSAKGPALGALLTKVAEANARAASLIMPVGAAATASQVLAAGGGTAITLAQYGITTAAAGHTLGYINSLTHHLVPGIPNYQKVGKRSLDEFNAKKDEFPRKIKQLIEEFNAKWNKGVKHDLTYPTTTTVNGQTYTFDGQSQMNQAVNDMETSYNNMVNDTDSALTDDMEVNRETPDTETNAEFNNRSKPSSVDDKYRCPSCKLYEFKYTNESTTQGHCDACGFTGLRPRSIEVESQPSKRGFPDNECPNSSNGRHSIHKSYTSLDSSSPVMIKNECEYCHQSYESAPTYQDFIDLEKYNCQNSVDPRTSFFQVSMGSMPIAVNLKYTSNGLEKNSEIAAKTSINMRPKYFGVYMWKRIS